MKLYVVDAYADRTKPSFSLYLVRSSSRENAAMAVESMLGTVDKVVAEEAKAEIQEIMPDLPQDSPVHLSDHEATWLQRG